MLVPLYLSPLGRGRERKRAGEGDRTATSAPPHPTFSLRSKVSLSPPGRGDQRVRPWLCAHPARLYIVAMTIEDIEQAVAKLPEDQLLRFRAWFEQFDAARFDQKIENDAASGKLDRLGDEAIDDRAAL